MQLRANVYSGEHRVREDLANLLAEHEYELQLYSISDKGPERTLVVRATRNRDSSQTHLNFNADPEQHPDNV